MVFSDFRKICKAECYTPCIYKPFEERDLYHNIFYQVYVGNLFVKGSILIGEFIEHLILVSGFPCMHKKL